MGLGWGRARIHCSRQIKSSKRSVSRSSRSGGLCSRRSVVISGRMCKEGQSPLMQVDQLFPSANVVVTPMALRTSVRMGMFAR